MKCPLFAIAASALILVADSSHAQTLDASYTPSSTNNGIIIGQRLSLAETFTVGTSGYLTRVDLLIFDQGDPNAPLTLDIRQLSGLFPTEPDSGATVLGSSSISATEVGTSASWITFTLAPIAVTAGQKLAIAVTSAAIGTEYVWVTDVDWTATGSPAGTYSGGQAFDRGSAAGRAPGDPTPSSQWGNIYFTNGTSSGGGANADMGFRTYISPAPEPSSGILAGAALLMLCGHRRFRRLRPA